MTHQPAHKWIMVLVAIVTIGSDALLLASGPREQRDPSMPVATFGDARFRFGNWITSLCFSPDGKLLASSSYYWGTALWDAYTGELIRHFPSDHSRHSQATFSPDVSLLVVACIDLNVWDVVTGELQYKIENAGRVVMNNRQVQFTRDGKHFLAVGAGALLFIETKTGRIVHEIETGVEPNLINGVALSPDGSRVMLGTNAVKTFDLTTGKEILPRPPQDHAEVAPVFSGRRIAGVR